MARDVDGACIGDVPAGGEYDVVVCGAGPAGIGAAVAAARAGASTLVIEQLYHVGGMGSSSRVNTWCDTPGGPIFDELEQRMAELGQARRFFDPKAHIYERGRVVLHGETLKAVALRMLHESGAEVWFGTTAARPWVVDGRVRGVLAANKGGLSLVKAGVVVDCTADADVAAGAGAELVKGDPDDGRLMHVNFMLQIEGVDYEAALRDALPEPALVDLIRAAHASGELAAPAGVFRPKPELFPYHEPTGQLVLTSWEIEGVDCSDPTAVSRTLVDCQLAALKMVEFCRRRLPGYAECRIGRFWNVLGTRESRRLVGRYTLTRDDVLTGRKFDDGVVRACFFIDFHDSPPGVTVPYTLEYKQSNTPPAGDCYEVPYRCLVPKTVTGLLVAGRCISAEREGIASLRVMPSCLFLGHAAGAGAALAVAQGAAPHEVDGREVRRRVLGD